LKRENASATHPMKMPLSIETASQHARSGMARDCFGPQTDYPFICLDLESASLDDPARLDALIQWLLDLPCPVIGVGTAQPQNQSVSDACDTGLTDPKTLARIKTNIERAPLAAMVFVQHLRASEALTLRNALIAESFAYASVQAGPDFQRWLAGYARSGSGPESAHPPLSSTVDNGVLTLTLTRPDTRNAIGVAMRDALCEALDLALIDPEINTIRIGAEGRTFSVGGDIAEFGQASDPATAHRVRSVRLPAQRLVQLWGKTHIHVHVNGAAIGAGAEIAAFGHHVTASPDAWFQLPELKYGLIPGAGGTVSVPRRIGRQRTAYMALSMARINAQTALDWGLIDAIDV